MMIKDNLFDFIYTGVVTESPEPEACDKSALLAKIIHVSMQLIWSSLKRVNKQVRSLQLLTFK